jgi:ArsR family transcriptional regulator
MRILGPSKEQERRAAIFKALADPTRICIIEYLRSCCPTVSVEEDSGEVRPLTGPTLGEVCCRITGADKITSNISRHLKELRQAGLITVERQGKSAICALNRQAIAELATYLRALPSGTCTEVPLASEDT